MVTYFGIYILVASLVIMKRMLVLVAQFKWSRWISDNLTEVITINIRSYCLILSISYSVFFS